MKMKGNKEIYLMDLRKMAVKTAAAAVFVLVPATVMAAAAPQVQETTVGTKFCDEGVNYEIISEKNVKVNGVTADYKNAHKFTKFAGKNSFTGYNLMVNETVTYADKTFNVTEIGNKAFKNDKKLGMVYEINVKKIGKEAFSGCVNLENFAVKEAVNLEEIGAKAFYRCGGLSSFTLCSNVKKIGSKAFGKTDLRELYNCSKKLKASKVAKDFYSPANKYSYIDVYSIKTNASYSVSSGAGRMKTAAMLPAKFDRSKWSFNKTYTTVKMVDAKEFRDFLFGKVKTTAKKTVKTKNLKVTTKIKIGVSQ